METLRELINIIKKYKVPLIEVIGNNNPAHAALPLDEFYESILNEEFMSDEEAANHFFDTPDKIQKYKKLKKTLKNQLINTSFFIDTSLPSFNEFQRAYYNCCKDWASINILMGRAARRTAIELAEKVLKQAIKYELTLLIVDITKTLKGHYGGFLRNKAKYDRYKDLFNKYQEVWHAEMEAEELYIDLITNGVQLKEHHKIADEYLKQLTPYTQKIQSHTLHFHFFLIELIKYTDLNDYRAMVITCEMAISFFENKDYLFKEPLSLFYYQKTVCHIHLKEYDQGKKTSDKNLDLCTKGGHKWSNQAELSLLLSLHTSKHNTAYDIFMEIQSHKNIFKSKANHWKLYETYLYYLVDLGKITFKDGQKNNLSKFRVGKFLNNVPSYSQEERDTNIPVLVIQILFILRKRRFEAVSGRIKEIEKYASSSLRKDEHYRSNCFIKMLLEISKARFHRAAVIRKTEKLLKKLKGAPLDTISQQSNIEIIPYEDLWNFILESLENSFH